MRKTIAGIILFLAQISLALWYNKTVDLVFVAVVAAVTFLYILYNYLTKKYAHE